MSTKSIASNFIKNLNQLSKGMSESQLAKVTQIPKSTINGLRSGRVTNPSIYTLFKLAQYFNVTVDELCGIKEKRNKAPRKLPILTLDQAKNWVHYVNSVNEASQYLLLAENENVSEGCYAVNVTTPAMQPCFPENSLLIIDPLLAPQHNDFVLVYIEDEHSTKFRQLVVEAQYRYLYPLNPQFKHIDLKQNHIFCGVVIQQRVNFKLHSTNHLN